ncbi:SAM-dependent methyltransferase [Tautonia sociabilis]|uniref:SAM-dependent methyltransferase n=1 Tax=Tautonia sociabilis TaxID=2080755 RepID=UPI001315376B|nr:cyclopropane-fatty-acyl-phospholipid synthase family protein [Tautonia sociabilis]
MEDDRFYRTLCLEGTLGAADAYLKGWWNSQDLVGLFRLLTRNRDVLGAVDGVLAQLARGLNAWGHFLRRNTVRGSRRNIAAHYDLGEDFYALFLDETMTYSAGVFLRPDSTLADSSREKYDRICRKLELTPYHHILEIGTGWGGFALHAAQHYGCRVTTTTISRRQYQHARDRVRQARLEPRITVLSDDYRNLTGVYDHLVCVEMVEAVGHQYLDRFFGQCSRLLRPDGLMLLQAITLPDHRFAQYVRSVDFIQKYIFPGGCLPSIGAIAAAVGQTTDFRFLHLEDFGYHYAQTLAHWRQRFWQNIDKVRSLGFDERFIRMWHYYLCYCEAGFLENQIGVAQILLAKPYCKRRPLLWIDDPTGTAGRKAST